MADNAYRGNPMYSRDMCQLMRDINALEPDSLLGVRDMTWDGTYYWLLTNNHEVHKYNSSWVYQSNFTLDTIGSADEEIGIDICSVGLAVIRTDRVSPTSVVRYIETYSTAGSRVSRFQVNGSRMAVCNDSFYTCDFANGQSTRTPQIWRYDIDGGPLGSTSLPQGASAGGSIHSDGADIYYHNNSRVWFSGYHHIYKLSPSLSLDASATAQAYAYTLLSETRLTSDGTYVYQLENATEIANDSRSLDTIVIYDKATLVYIATLAESWDYWVVADVWNGSTHKTLLTTRPRDLDDEYNTTYTLNTWTYSSPTFSGSTADVSIGNSGQTRWNAYGFSSAVDLGDPDGGVSVPELESLTASTSPGTVLSVQHLLDMRAAVEALATSYTNAVTTNAFNWTDDSADNLYYVAMGDRTDYGATGGARYDWTHSAAELIGNPCYDIDIGEIYECVAKLKASDPV